MYKLHDFMGVLEQVAPLSCSHKMIERGDYDNSGIIVQNSNEVNRVLFSLDLSLDAVNKAIELNCDTIVTHHPAIYMPIKSLGVDQSSKPLLLAIKNGMNVISMHLNLDIASGGIDHSLAVGLGAKGIKVLDLVDDECGYGRLSTLQKQPLQHFVDQVKQTFNTQKIICYGQNEVQKVASFCGSGGSVALSVLGGQEIDTIVTSDLAHHQLKEMIEQGKNVVIIPHYVSEQFGFNIFYQTISKMANQKIESFYFVDNRFM